MKQNVYADLERAELRFLAEELERRIAELENDDQRVFGSFTGVDWFLCVVFFVVLPALVILDRYPDIAWAFRMATVLVVASFGHPWLYFMAQRARGKTWREALAIVPAIVAGNMGIAINNTRALFEGLSGRQSAFVRTPKYALRSRRDHWKGKKYQVPA